MSTYFRTLFQYSPSIVTQALYVLTLFLTGIAAYTQLNELMDGYELLFLFGALIACAFIGLTWVHFRRWLLGSLAIALLATGLYANELSNAHTNLALKWFLSSQSSILWMSTLFTIALIVYLLNLFRTSKFMGLFASTLSWSALTFGSSALLVRWHESYLKDPQSGHIPISNLYEVVILFCLLTTLLYLWHEYRYQTRTLGAFIMLIVCSGVAFILWYAYTRSAHDIQPLVPALQSYWMKIHVPANFIGYGGFTIAAMVSIAWLLRANGYLTKQLPPEQILEEIMYRSIAVGFAFFTVATILGALWAAEAWGTYWQWDPKETWALIVWLNYAAWLHMRIIKGFRGKLLAWWTLLGLLVTLFAFFGVNLFLSGLHSYGTL